MKNNEQGFIKFLLLIAVIVGGLFFFKASDGQSYGKKIVLQVEDFINGIKGKAYNARDLMQEHQDELQKAIDEN